MRKGIYLLGLVGYVLALFTLIYIGLADPTPQEALSQVMTIQTKMGHGMAVPISPRLALTCLHMFKPEDPDPRAALAITADRVYQAIKMDPINDLVILDLVQGPEVISPLILATTLPKPLEVVYYLVPVDHKGDNGIVMGRFIRIDLDGDLVIDGNGQFGMSGGGCVNSSGHLVGIMKALGRLSQTAVPFSVATNLVGREIPDGN